MMTRETQNLIEQIGTLGPEELAQLESFVKFLIFRSEERKATRLAAAASEASFAAIWNNPEDEAYDAL